MIDPLNKLCKWRTVLAGWHHGTKSIDQNGSKAMRDLMDKWLIMRSETNAMAALLIEKGFFTAEEYTAKVYHEAALLDAALEREFEGFRTTDIGLEIYDLTKARKMMARLGFPP